MKTVHRRNDRFDRKNGKFGPNLLMGQRFLRSRRTLEKIAAAADLSPADTVLEIGPGLGILTLELAKRAGRVIAIEKDERLFQALEKKLKTENVSNVRLIRGDILKIPISQFLNFSISYKVVANIPYYLTGRLIRKMLEDGHRPKEMTLMVQKEVAERICAHPPKMNLLALSVQAYGKSKIIARVPASAFWPRPKVDSAIIKVTGISDEFFVKSGFSPQRFFSLIKSAFSQKRKTLANSLAEIAGGKKDATAVLEKSGLNPAARPEELSLNDWAILAREFILKEG